MCTPPTPPEMTYGFLMQLVFCKKKKYVVYPGAEVEQQTSAPPPKKNPGSAPGDGWNTQEKSKTASGHAKFGGQTRCFRGDVQLATSVVPRRSLLKSLGLIEPRTSRD